MKPSDPRFWLLTLAGSALIGFCYSSYLHLQDEITALEKKVAALEIQGLRQSRLAFVTVAAKPASSIRDEVFRALQTLNGVKSPQDGDKEKRILLGERELVLRDPEVAKEDAFYDLLGSLLDEDLIEKIEMPDAVKLEKGQRGFYRSIRQELLRFGVSADDLVTANGPVFRILLKKPI